MKTRNRQQIIDLYNSLDKKTYEKSGMYLIRKGEIGEFVITICAGEVETTVLIKDENRCYILRNITIGSASEEYVIEECQFLSRYDLIDEEAVKYNGTMWKKYKAKGCVVGGMYEGEDFKFEAPWGEEMLVKSGDMIVQPVNTPEGKFDIYRIEKRAFADTYGDV